MSLQLRIAELQTAAKGTVKAWEKGDSVERICSLNAYLGHRDDDKHATAAGLGNYGEEFGVDGAEDAVVGVGRHLDVIVALFSLLRLAVDVAKLGLTHDLRHL